MKVAVYSSVTNNTYKTRAAVAQSQSYLDEMEDIDLQRSNGYLQHLSLLNTADFIDSKHYATAVGGWHTHVAIILLSPPSPMIPMRYAEMMSVLFLQTHR